MDNKERLKATEMAMQAEKALVLGWSPQSRSELSTKNLIALTERETGVTRQHSVQHFPEGMLAEEEE